MSETREYSVFKDEHGNRFVFPGIYKDDKNSINWSFNRYLCMVTGAIEEKELFSVPIIDGMVKFPHIKSTVTSSGFKHGREDVFIIGGPIFDEVVANGKG